MALIIQHPPKYIPERQYIIDVILGEFLGLEYRLEPQERDDIRISLERDTINKEFLVADVLFQTAESEWLQPSSLPQQPLQVYNLPGKLVDENDVKSSIPVIFGEYPLGLDSPQIQDNKIRLGLDVFGSAFFMLTRYEELVNAKRDNYERFNAGSSLSFQEGFLERPVVNEYLEIFWKLLKHLWPQLRRKYNNYRIFLSHDVDKPLYHMGKGFLQVLRNCLGDLAKRRDLFLAFRRLRNYAHVSRGSYDGDLYDTFDLIMDTSDKYGLKSDFNFMADRTSAKFDVIYRLEDPWIRKLVKRIYDRGHGIGLHPSFNTFRDPVQTKKEFEDLSRLLNEEGIRHTILGSRQHYLRWENPTTWQNLEDAGLVYDSSLSYADHVGFRCGVCYEFPAFNLKTRRRLKLRERPLIVMDRTLLDYMNLGFESSLQKILDLSSICRSFKGDFTLLWHNSSLVSEKQKKLYLSCLDVITR